MEDGLDNKDEDGRCLRKMQGGDILDTIFSFNGGVAQTGFHFLIKRRTALLASLEELEVLLCAMKKIITFSM